MSVFTKTRSTDTVVIYVLRKMRMPLIALISVFALAVLGLVLIPGIDPDGNRWYMSFLDAFYFVSYMATTIGFGEIPYPFSPAQRLWVSLMIYPTVIIWLYAFGTILTLMQDPTFKMALTESAYSRHVRRIKTPFLLVCGYGDTGHLLVRHRTQNRQQVVVIDIAQEVINELSIEDHAMFVPGLGADASQSEHLIKAGLGHAKCAGVAAITDDDRVNLKIAINCKLLNPNIEVACRVERKEVEANMASFGTDHLINPFDIFTGQMMLSLFSPIHFMLYQLITEGVIHEERHLSQVPQGLWIICGYGRLGRTIHQQLLKHGVETITVDVEPERRGAPSDCIIGRGTEANTLEEAQIGRAVGIIAATADDADNLSILMTAKELNPGLFIVARQNIKANEALFKAIDAHKIMQNNHIVAREVTARLSTPLLHQFISHISELEDHQVETSTQQLLHIGDTADIRTWQVCLDDDGAAAVSAVLQKGEVVHLNDLLKHPWEKSKQLPMISLCIKRDHHIMVLPQLNMPLQLGDTILFCGNDVSIGHSLLHHHETLMENLI